MGFTRRDEAHGKANGIEFTIQSCILVSMMILDLLLALTLGFALTACVVTVLVRFTDPKSQEQWYRASQDAEAAGSDR